MCGSEHIQLLLWIIAQVALWYCFFQHRSFDFVLWDFWFVFILPQEGLVQL